MTFSRRCVVTPPPEIAYQPRVRRDVRNLLDFIDRQPWGKPDDRKKEIDAAYERIRRAPFARSVCKWARNGKIGLRCYYAGQFAIIYAYLGAPEEYPHGVVSIRAVRHHRERDVLFGVTENGMTAPCPPLRTGGAP
jgi:hypothetical protein